MLGADWIKRHGCIIDLQRGIVTIQGKEMKLEARDGSSMCRRVVVVRREEIPAWTECVIEGRVELGKITEDAGEDWCTEVRDIAPGVCVARALLPDRFDDVPVMVMNVSDVPVILEAGSELSELESTATLEGKVIRTLTSFPTTRDVASPGAARPISPHVTFVAGQHQRPSKPQTFHSANVSTPQTFYSAESSKPQTFQFRRLSAPQNLQCCRLSTPQNLLHRGFSTLQN